MSDAEKAIAHLRRWLPMDHGLARLDVTVTELTTTHRPDGSVVLHLRRDGSVVCDTVLDRPAAEALAARLLGKPHPVVGA